MKKQAILVFISFLAVGLFFCNRAFSLEGETPDQTNAPETSLTQDLLRSNLELQNQLHTALRAIEQSRQDADASAKRNADLLTERLNSVEKNLALQREHYLETMVSMRESNRFALIGAVLLAGVGLLALFLTAYFQIRAMNRMAEMGALLSTSTRVDSARTLGEGMTSTPALLNSSDQVTTRFFAAIEQLEKRIHELDSLHPTSTGQTSFSAQKSPDIGERSGQPEITSAASSQINSWLADGQALLNNGDAEKALAFFEKAVALEPNSAEALVKKGTALEALRKMPEAIATYDRAIATDNSMTVAYLYKGGALNRLQRFTEAMECYEQALRTHPKKAA